jgi:hypothetical protein
MPRGTGPRQAYRTRLGLPRGMRPQFSATATRTTAPRILCVGRPLHTNRPTHNMRGAGPGAFLPNVAGVPAETAAAAVRGRGSSRERSRSLGSNRCRKVSGGRGQPHKWSHRRKRSLSILLPSGRVSGATQSSGPRQTLKTRLSSYASRAPQQTKKTYRT